MEIINFSGAPNVAKVVEPTACFSMPSLSSVGGQAGKVSAPVMALPRVCHASHTPSLSRSVHSQTRSLHLHGIIQEAHNSVHLPLAPVLVPSLGVCQRPVLQAHQDHHNQDPVLGLVPAPKHVQMVVVLMCQFFLILHLLKLYWCTATRMIPPQLEKRMHLTQTTKKICHKVLCHCPIFLPLMIRTLAQGYSACETMHGRVMSNMLTGKMNKSTRRNERYFSAGQGDL